MQTMTISCVSTVVNSWQWASFTLGPNEQNQQTKNWDKKHVYTCGSAAKRFAKFGRQKRTFCGKKEEKAVSQLREIKISDLKLWNWSFEIVKITNSESMRTLPSHANIIQTK